MNTSPFLHTISKELPLIHQLCSLTETNWFNPAIKTTSEGLRHVGLTKEHIDEAEQRMIRFAPFFRAVYPETRGSHGIIESPLRRIPHMQQHLQQNTGIKIPGTLLIKLDSELPISGSIKARGGIYEVLVYAEQLALTNGLLPHSSDYEIFTTTEFKGFFSQYSIVVGSTGNLGLSIGIISRALGFNAIIHMSTDARQWKKDMLRAIGAHVIEHSADYSQAVQAGREKAANTNFCHFVDDENSTNLFLGYAVAARRLKKQLMEAGITVDSHHPLFVYLPCGVGGGPGGVSFGLKTEFGDNVHCIFVEPTHSPSMFLGVYTGLHDQICVQDIGLDNRTIADGLACGRPSGFVGQAMQYLIDGYTTVSDSNLQTLLKQLYAKEGIFIEPSSTAGFKGMLHTIKNQDYLNRIGMSAEKISNATHIVWATGGSMVPEKEKALYLHAS